MKVPGNLRHSSLLASCLLGLGLCQAALGADPVLKNSRLSAQFGPSGLVSITEQSSSRLFGFQSDSAAITVGDQTLDTAALKPTVKADATTVTYAYQANGWDLKVVYELKPDWGFVSKQVVLSGDKADYRVKTVDVFQGALDAATAARFKQTKGTLFLRFGEGAKPSHGLLFALQNFFPKSRYADGKVTVAYEPNMDWKSSWGAFASDRVCLAPYVMSGAEVIKGAPAEWQYLPDPEKAVANADKIDIAEIETYQQAVRAFLEFRPTKSLRIHVGWCVNDYQIDCGTPEGMTEYKRIIDRAAETGCQYILYAPANSQVSSEKECRDAWGWENLLFLGMSQKMRKNEWDPAKDPLPDVVKGMVDYAKAKNVKFVAYAYPSLPWTQNPEWMAWVKNPGGYLTVDTGLRSFQDWFVGKCVDFQKNAGVAGYSFDHWWIAYDSQKESKVEVSSKYAQWYGTRRILSELRKKVPDILIDGRQQYCWFGPWTVVGGTYPHPFGGDEQPGSFRARADLHTDRLSANHVRYINWRYLMEGYYPVEVVPGYMTHQTQRSDAAGKMHRDPWRRADWDYLGWRYSVISSIATAPYHHVVNFIPARDTQEFNAFSKDDQAWLRRWLDWTDQNMATLKNLRILCPPLVGRTDLSAAFDGDHGFVFAFNANYRKLNADFTLDKSLGLTKGEQFVITQLYPREGMVIGKPGAGLWNAGDKVTLPMDGASAVVLSVTPASRLQEPILCNATGKAALNGSTLALTGIKGEVGTTAELVVALPEGQKPSAATVNGKSVKFTQNGSALTLSVRFAGTPFGQCQQVGSYDPQFKGRSFKGEFVIPQRIFDQLKARKAAWPVTYTEDDLIAPWIGPDRLLLFVNIADAHPGMDVTMKLNGESFPLKKAFNGIYPNSGNQTFIGFYADVASLKPDTKYQVEIGLPEIADGPQPKPDRREKSDPQPVKLSTGQFQGLHFDNVEPEFTETIAE